MNNKVLDIITKLEKDNQVVIETDFESYTLYYGYKSGITTDNIPNPLEFCKGIMYIRVNKNQLEVFNNTGTKFESIKNINEENGFRNLIKELYERGFRVDEHKYDEEMLGYTSIEIINSEYNNVFECIEKYNCFSNSNILSNKEVFYTAHEQFDPNENKENCSKNYYRITNCINFYETYENKEYLIINKLDKKEMFWEKIVSFDKQDHRLLIKGILKDCSII